jgi:hypothetical protein
MLAEEVQHETMQERIARIRQRLASIPEDKVLVSQQGRSDSICWECANCCPSKCAWAAELEPIWDKAFRVSSSGQALGPHAYRVQECKHFKKEGVILA